MQDISFYFQPNTTPVEDLETDMLGTIIERHTEGSFPALDKKGIALIQVNEYRNSNTPNFNYKDVADFRKALYRLYTGINWNIQLYDLGTIQPGKEISDTYHAISKVVEQLIKIDITPIIIGGSNDLILPLYKGYENLEQLVNITSIDATLDLGDPEEEIHNKGWLAQLLSHQPCTLFNFSNLSAQSHYISPKVLQLIDNLYFDITRLGTLNSDIKVAEPILRNTDLVSFDLTAIRSSDIKGENYLHPNGLFAQEACKLAHYAGISDKLSSFGLFEYYPTQNQSTTQELVAQLIWYFIEGYANRKGDFPIGSKKTYTTFRVTFDEKEEEIVFLKSDKSGRWWMEVPYPSTTNSKFQRHHLVPCSYEDYQLAMQGEIPNLWWKTYQKLV
jgi:arginase family enzyme